MWSSGFASAEWMCLSSDPKARVVYLRAPSIGTQSPLKTYCPNLNSTQEKAEPAMESTVVRIRLHSFGLIAPSVFANKDPSLIDLVARFLANYLLSSALLDSELC